MAQRTCDVEGCEKPHLARGLCRLHWKREYGKPTRYKIECHTCDAEWLSARKDGRFCSDACKGEAYKTERRKSRAMVGPVEPDRCVLPTQHPVQQMMMLAAIQPRLWISATCAWCASCFLHDNPRIRFCSKRCQTNAARAKRGRFIIPRHRRLAIYERDEWTCQLCMGSVDPTLSVSDVWAATLDHIICQAWGEAPDHSDANLRLAHRWCNSVRGDETVYSPDVLRISPVA